MTQYDKKALDAYWLPFTSNRSFKKSPTILASAKGAYYYTDDGKKLFDCLSGLWCCPLGHGHPKIAEAVSNQAKKLDYSTAFSAANPDAMELAGRIAAVAPIGMDKVFFTNSGSEAVDTALKIALGYHRIRGEGQRFRMIGRERGYHGVGFGGMSVGGMVANRKMFPTGMLPGVDHLPHTHNPSEMAFSKGQPKWGGHLANELEKLVALHDASTIAAVIVEPVQGSTGVLVPPIGYLERLREICTAHGILLIFDEIITGFGRMGHYFGAQRFNVTPDMITFAKGVTNGVIPMGGVIVNNNIYETFMGVQTPEYAPEFFHGYTYSGHPMASAVGNTTFKIMEEEDLISQVQKLEPILEKAMHSLKVESSVTDIRNIGLAAAVDLKSIAGKPGLRGSIIFKRAIEKGLLIRLVGDTVAVGPPFISTQQEIEDMVAILLQIIEEVPAA